MSDVELRNYFNTELEKIEATACSNPQCNCFAILCDGNARSSVARYLTWFSQREPKHDRFLSGTGTPLRDEEKTRQIALLSDPLH